MKLKIGALVVFSLGILFLTPPVVLACDICAIYTSIDAKELRPNDFHLGIAEQYTNYGTVLDNGHKIDNPLDQYMKSSITQIFGSYDITKSLSTQLTIPLIDRSYRRASGMGTESGNESGLGDMSLLLRYYPVQYQDDDKFISIQIFGGLKFATGDSDRIGEELEEGHHGGAMESEDPHHGHEMLAATRHGDEGDHSDAPVSAIHGHDLALGSGSTDFPLGAAVYAQHGRYFASADIQYAIRTRGSFDYEYADDLVWATGVGALVVLKDSFTMGIKANLSGEYKGKDNLAGVAADDTGIRTIFAGPEFLFTFGPRLSADLGFDFPLDVNTTDVQIAPDYKIRAAVNWVF